LLGDQREREQLEISLGKHAANAEPVAASTSIASPPAGAFALMAAEAPGGPQAPAMAAVMS
jgi:hypothetical protein